MTTSNNRAAGEHERHSAQQGFAVGATFAAATLLLVVSILAVLQGISAIANDELFVVGTEYVYKFDLTAWGWIVLIVGILGILIACGLYVGATWARVAAVVIASLSIIANFLWLPYYPWWSILVIALDVIVIWAVTTWRTEA